VLPADSIVRAVSTTFGGMWNGLKAPQGVPDPSRLPFDRVGYWFGQRGCAPKRKLIITTRNIDVDQVQVPAEDSGPRIDPDTSPVAWAWDFPSAVPFFRAMGGGCGLGRRADAGDLTGLGINARAGHRASNRIAGGVEPQYTDAETRKDVTDSGRRELCCADLTTLAAFTISAFCNRALLRIRDWPMSRAAGSGQ